MTHLSHLVWQACDLPFCFKVLEFLEHFKPCMLGVLEYLSGPSTFARSAITSVRSIAHLRSKKTGDLASEQETDKAPQSCVLSLEIFCSSYMAFKFQHLWYFRSSHEEIWLYCWLSLRPEGPTKFVATLLIWGIPLQLARFMHSALFLTIFSFSVLYCIFLFTWICSNPPWNLNRCFWCPSSVSLSTGWRWSVWGIKLPGTISSWQTFSALCCTVFLWAFACKRLGLSVELCLFHSIWRLLAVTNWVSFDLFWLFGL